jgi:hypothetical protein
LHEKNSSRPRSLPGGHGASAPRNIETDPGGQKGTLVPLSTAGQFKPGEVPKGAQPFPGTRGTPKTGGLHRTYAAVDPEYFEGEYRGEGTVYLSPLPYHGTTPCQADR